MNIMSVDSSCFLQTHHTPGWVVGLKPLLFTFASRSAFGT